MIELDWCEITLIIKSAKNKLLLKSTYSTHWGHSPPPSSSMSVMYPWNTTFFSSSWNSEFKREYIYLNICTNYQKELIINVYPNTNQKSPNIKRIPFLISSYQKIMSLSFYPSYSKIKFYKNINNNEHLDCFNLLS